MYSTYSAILSLVTENLTSLLMLQFYHLWIKTEVHPILFYNVLYWKASWRGIRMMASNYSLGALVKKPCNNQTPGRYFRDVCPGSFLSPPPRMPVPRALQVWGHPELYIEILFLHQWWGSSKQRPLLWLTQCFWQDDTLCLKLEAGRTKVGVEGRAC